MPWIDGVRLADLLRVSSSGDARPVLRSAGEPLAAISGSGFAAAGFFDYHLRIAAPLEMSKQVVVDYTAELPARGTAGQLGSQLAGRRRQPRARQLQPAHSPGAARR